MKHFKSIYRQEPISSFILTVGAVDAVMGGVGDRWFLLALGLGTVSVAIALRYWKVVRRRQFDRLSNSPTRYLPSRSSRPSLPMLTLDQKNPPR